MSFFALMALARLIHTTGGSLAIHGLISLAAFADMLVGTVVAVIGLSECKRASPPYVQGRSQAITGLVIMGLTSLLVIAIYGDKLHGVGNRDTKPQIHKEFNLSFDRLPRNGAGSTPR